MQDDPELTAVVRSRQLHIYRNGKKVLVLAGKSAPKVIREDRICNLVQKIQYPLTFCGKGILSDYSWLPYSLYEIFSGFHLSFGSGCSAG